jgi:hypothetical protein
MRRFPLRHPGRDFVVVLGELAKLSEDVLLRGAGRLGNERRGAEQLPRRIPPSLHLQDPSHLTVLGDIQGDEHDHSPGQYATEGEKVWAHGTKVPPTRA